jgi:osmotically-inducible protein OsmY
MKAQTILMVMIVGTASVACSKPDRLDTSEITTTSSNLTPMDQGSSKQDRTITAAVRQTVMKNTTLSIDAQNVAIITRDGVVTLQGGVKSEQERATIEFAATNTPGAVRVDDKLTIEGPSTVTPLPGVY